MITGIYERNGKIYVRTTYRGIPIYKTFAGNTTRYQKQADKFLREAKYLIDNGEYCTERKTLEQAYLDMDKTLRTSGRKKEQSTITTDRNFYNHIAPILNGSRYIDTFTREELRRFPIKLNEKGLKPSMQATVIRLCRQIFKTAYIFGWTTHDYYGVIAIPKVTVKEVDVMNEDNATTLFNEAEKIYNKNPIPLLVLSFGYYYGSRVAEMCGYEWQDVDFENGYLNTCRQRNSTVSRLTEPKTESSKQALKMRPELQAILKRQWERVKDKAKPDNAIITTIAGKYKGKHVSVSNVERNFRNFILSCNINEPVTIHKLRRTCETNVAIEKDVYAAMIQARHSRPDTTLKHYINRKKLADKYIQ